MFAYPAENGLNCRVSDPTDSPSPNAYHVPVLLAECLELLDIRPDAVCLDATLGGGGHARAILDCLTGVGRLIGMDQDAAALEQAKRWSAPYGDRFLAVHANYDNLERALEEAGIDALDAALFDLGVSSHQLDVPERGFSFRADGPLDMRMDPDRGRTAADLIRNWSEQDLTGAIRTWGEERHAHRIGRAIHRERDRIETTADLAEVVKRAIPGGGGRDRIHPATRTFQALRIAVNDELPALQRGLEAALHRLAPNGRIVVIAYHSLEDRIVKHLFRERSTECICPPRMPECRCGHRATLDVLTRKPVTPSEAEVAANPRARSARARAARRLPADDKPTEATA